MPPIRSTSQAPRRLLPSDNPQRPTRRDPTAQMPTPILVPVVSGPTIFPAATVNPVVILPDTVSHNQEPVVGPEPSTDTQDNSDPPDVTNSRDEAPVLAAAATSRPSATVQPHTVATSHPLATAPPQLSLLDPVDAAVSYFIGSESFFLLSKTYNNEANDYHSQAQLLLDSALQYHESGRRYQAPKRGEMAPPPGKPAYSKRMRKVAIAKLREGIERQKYGNVLARDAEACYDLGITKVVNDEKLYDVEQIGIKYSHGWQNYLRASDLAQQAVKRFGYGAEKYRRGNELFKEADSLYNSRVQTQNIPAPVEVHSGDSIVPPPAG